MGTEIELAEFIGHMHDEMDKAQQAGKDKNLQFEVGPIEVELAVQSQKEAHAGGGVRFYLVSVGADGKVADASIQRIKLTLKPSVRADANAAVPAESERPWSSAGSGGGGGMTTRPNEPYPLPPHPRGDPEDPKVYVEHPSLPEGLRETEDVGYPGPSRPPAGGAGGSSGIPGRPGGLSGL